MAILVWVICSIYLQNFRVTAILEMRCFEECVLKMRCFEVTAVLDMRCFEVTAHTVLLDINYHLWQQFYTSKAIYIIIKEFYLVWQDIK